MAAAAQSFSMMLVIALWLLCSLCDANPSQLLEKLNPEIFDNIIQQLTHFERLQLSRTGRQARSLINDYYKYNGLDQAAECQMCPYDHVRILTISSDEQRELMAASMRESRIQLMLIRNALSTAQPLNEQKACQLVGWLYNSNFYAYMVNFTEANHYRTEVKRLVATVQWPSDVRDKWHRAIAHFQTNEILSDNPVIAIGHHKRYRRDLFDILGIESLAEGTPAFTDVIRHSKVDDCRTVCK